MLTKRPISWQQALGVRVAGGLFSAMVILVMPHSLVFGDESRAILQVDYTAPTISIEAHHVSVQDVLLAVGDQVGFTVDSIGPITATVRHLSLHDASVQEVLDTLLGGKNYAMSYHPASASSDEAIDNVFVLGAPESKNVVTSRVGTTGGHYPSSAPEVPFPMQDSPASFAELRGLNEPNETNQKEPSDLDPNLVRQHQQEVEKARSLFESLDLANQLPGGNGRTGTPSNLPKSTGGLLGGRP